MTSPFPQDIVEQARAIIEKASKQGIVLATAESCTGGLISAALTEIAGSSAAFDRAFITYSNTAKTELLGVPTLKIARNGAVSVEVAEAMAEGAIERSAASMVVSVTGIAGPSGGSKEKPVGTVCFGTARQGRETQSEMKHFDADTREGVREATVRYGLSLFLDALDG